MFRLPAALVERIDAGYRDRPYFIRLNARLFAAFALLVLVFVPCNIAKVLWVHPAEIPLRIVLNAVMGIGAACSLFAVRRSRLELAGSLLAIPFLLAMHAAVLLIPADSFREPLSTAIQLFINDIVFLLVALIFSTRAAAIVALGIAVGGNIGFHFRLLSGDRVAEPFHATAVVLLRDGTLALGFVFVLGVTLIRMIEAAHRRSEEAL